MNLNTKKRLYKTIMDSVSVYVKKALLESEEMSIREKMLDKIDNLVGEKFKEYGINTFISDIDDLNFLNPYFGFNHKSYSDSGAYIGGVKSVHIFARGRFCSTFRISVSVYPRGWNSKEVRYEIKDMNDRMIRGIYDLVSKKIHDRETEIEKSMNNKPLEEILPEAEAIA